MFIHRGINNRLSAPSHNTEHTAHSASYIKILSIFRRICPGNFLIRANFLKRAPSQRNLLNRLRNVTSRREGIIPAGRWLKILTIFPLVRECLSLRSTRECQHNPPCRFFPLPLFRPYVCEFHPRNKIHTHTAIPDEELGGRGKKKKISR